MPPTGSDHPTLFDVPEEMWVRRRCGVCGCSLSVSYEFTYVVQRQQWVKVGATNQPQRRINELRRPAWTKHLLSPPGMDWQEPLTTLAVMMGHDEHDLHRRFRKQHVVGEWFLPDRAMTKWLREVSK